MRLAGSSGGLVAYTLQASPQRWSTPTLPWTISFGFTDLQNLPSRVNRLPFSVLSTVTEIRSGCIGRLFTLPQLPSRAGRRQIVDQTTSFPATQPTAPFFRARRPGSSKEATLGPLRATFELPAVPTSLLQRLQTPEQPQRQRSQERPGSPEQPSPIHFDYYCSCLHRCGSLAGPRGRLLRTNIQGGKPWLSPG